MKKISLRFLMTLLVAAAVMLPFCAISYAEPASATYVLDYADVLTDTEEQNFLTYADSFYANTGWYAAFVTTDDTEYKTSMEYADDTYDELFGINTDGVLFLIDFDSRNYYISTSGEAILAIDDYDVERILDAAESYMSSQNYSGAGVAAFQKVESLCYSYRDGGSYDSDTVSFSIDIVAVLVAFVLAAVAFVLVIVGVLNAYKNKTAPTADVYAKGSDGFVLHQSTDTFIREYTTSVKIESSSGGSHSGGSSHRSSGGGSHGGGGRGF